MVNKLFKDFNLYIIFSITLIAVMGVASITPAFPQVIKHYGLTAKQIGYLITVFTLPVLVLPLAFIVLFKLKTPYVRNKIKLKIYLGKLWLTINQKKAWGLFLVNILVFIILYGAFLSFFPLLMEERFQADSIVIGGVMSLASVITAIFSILLGWARKRFKPHTLLYFSSFVYAASLIILLVLYFFRLAVTCNSWKKKINILSKQQ